MKSSQEICSPKMSGVHLKRHLNPYLLRCHSFFYPRKCSHWTFTRCMNTALLNMAAFAQEVQA